MSGFGFSVGDIVLGIKVLAKIGRAFHSGTGAAAKYGEALGLLRSLKTTLDAITTYSQENSDYFYADSILEQLGHIKAPWEAFNGFLVRFRPLLDANADHGVLRKTRRTIEYALRDLNGEIERLKLAITQPLQVINVFLTLQATYNVPFDGRKQATHSTQHDLAESSTTSLPDTLRAELDRLHATQAAHMAQLVSAVKNLAVCGDRRPSIAATSASLGSTLDTEVSSVFSARQGSLYTMTDSESTQEFDEKMPTKAHAASAHTTAEICHKRLIVRGYRRLEANEQQQFFVPGRLFLTIQPTPTCAVNRGNSSTRPVSRHATTATQPEVGRFLVIRNEGTCSLCVRVRRPLTRLNAPSNDLGPYEVPLSTAMPEADDPESNSMTLQMQDASEGPITQLPTHAYVKLRHTYIVQNDAKLMNMGAMTGDDLALLLALWHDANE